MLSILYKEGNCADVACSLDTQPNADKGVKQHFVARLNTQNTCKLYNLLNMWVIQEQVHHPYIEPREIKLLHVVPLVCSVALELSLFIQAWFK